MSKTSKKSIKASSKFVKKTAPAGATKKAPAKKSVAQVAGRKAKAGAAAKTKKGEVKSTPAPAAKKKASELLGKSRSKGAGGESLIQNEVMRKNMASLLGMSVHTDGKDADGDEQHWVEVGRGTEYETAFFLSGEGTRAEIKQIGLNLYKLVKHLLKEREEEVRKELAEE